MANGQSVPAIASDGNGGAIITWQDNRSGNSDIYAQRISTDGLVQWNMGGVAICTATGNQSLPTIVSDGSGGAIITWEDYRSGNLDIYAQRINADSIVQWTADGVALCTATGNQSYPTIVSDGSGGAIIAWQDTRSVPETGVYVQRISAGGIVQWAENGVALCTVGGTQSHATSIISDGSGGAIVAWEDARAQSNTDIYAQRINAGGIVQWTAEGVAICTAINNQIYPSMVSDGSGGAFITWQDLRNGSYYDIYAQRINADSTVHWTSNGVAICTAMDNQSTPNITRDGIGGAIITWHDNRSGNMDIYAQRINADSTVRWTADGAAVCTVAGGQAYPVAVSDGSGGAVILWWDYRDEVNYNIYAQRIGDGGTIQWPVDGVAICTATGHQSNPLIVSDGSGGAIATWEDQRSGSNSDIYAQRIYSTGNLYTSVKDISGIVPHEFTLGQNYPNPFNPSTTIEIGLPVRSQVTLRVYNMLGQEVALLINGRELPAGSQHVSWIVDLSSGVYMYRMEAVSLNNPARRFVEAKKMLLVK